MIPVLKSVTPILKGQKLQLWLQKMRETNKQDHYWQTRSVGVDARALVQQFSNVFVRVQHDSVLVEYSVVYDIAWVHISAQIVSQ